MEYISPLFVRAYTVSGPQSAAPFPRVKEAISRSVQSRARKLLEARRSGMNDIVCCGSSASSEMSYSLHSSSVRRRTEPV